MPRHALGLSSDGGDDLFLVGAAALTLMATAAEARPLLCVIDDAQWLDASLAAITFAARRLQAERIAVLFAVREDDEDADTVATELPELRLEGLDPEASAALFADETTSPLAPQVLERIITSANGLTNQVVYYRALVGWTAALLGLVDETQREAQAALQLARASDGVWAESAASLALGELELGLGRWADAVTLLGRLSTTGSPLEKFERWVTFALRSHSSARQGLSSGASVPRSS